MGHLNCRNGIEHIKLGSQKIGKKKCMVVCPNNVHAYDFYGFTKLVK